MTVAVVYAISVKQTKLKGINMNKCKTQMITSASVSKKVVDVLRVPVETFLIAHTAAQRD